MRALVSAAGTRGDVHPAIALALELRKLGHGVRMCISPNFVAFADSLGLEARPMGVEMRAPARGAGATKALTPDELERLRESMPDLITDQFETIGGAADACDVIVGGNAHQYAAPSIAQLNGIGCVTAVYSPNALPSPELAPPPPPGQASGATQLGIDERWRETKKMWNDRSLERVNSNRRRLGLPAIDDVLEYTLTDRTWLATDAALGPIPATPGRTIFQTGAWVLRDTAPLPADLEAFLVSQGWAGLGVVGNAADCLTVGEVSHERLFPRVAAVVHHGGAGTTAAAARAGVPQVITPMFGDQFYWAERVVQLGLGSTLPFSALTEQSLARALRLALTLEAAARARQFAAQVTFDGATIAARRLEAEYAPTKRS